MAVSAATWDMYDLIQGLLQAPAYHVVFEVLLILLVAKLFFSKSYKPQKITLSEKEEAVKALMKYGVGSCGPRGFYGTMDVHLELEEHLAHFMQTEEAILYSYGFVTIASAIPAYAKRGDVIFADEGIGFAAQKGCVASRSTVKWFRHNDMEHLEQLLLQQQEEDKKNVKKAKATRKFLVVEGIYSNYGDLCPLPKLVELKWKYKVRIFLEESLSFGVLGATGRGITEHFGVPIENIEMVTASLENSMASIGGFCCGKKFIIDHQRLSGIGYCFSASQPPMVAVAATKALELMEKEPVLLVKLRENCQRVYQAAQEIEGMAVRGSPLSPVQHLQLSQPSADRDQDMRTLQAVQDLVISQGVAITVARYLDQGEHLLHPPSIRLAVSAHLTADEIDKCMVIISNTFHTVLQNNNAGDSDDGDCTESSM